MAQENAGAENQNAVTLKLPPFWTSQARVWFQQPEAQFALRHVSVNDTKYCYVVAALDQETAQRLLSSLENPPAHGKYQAFKQRLPATFDPFRNNNALLAFFTCLDWETANHPHWWMTSWSSWEAIPRASSPIFVCNTFPKTLSFFDFKKCFKTHIFNQHNSPED